MSELRRSLAAARPVLAGVVGAVCICPAVWLTPCENVVHIGLVADAVHQLTLLIHGVVFRDEVPQARQFQCVAMQVFEVTRDHRSAGVVPWPFADPVPCIDGGLAFTH